MKHLFSPEGDAALAAIMARNPLLAFDFDGTLAPIVARPEDARVALPVARRLDRLARRLPLAIISGRAVGDLRQRLSFEPHYILGNHGAEDPGSPDSAAYLAVMDGMRERLQARAIDLARVGVQVEDKRYSMALHYRQSPDHAAALALIQELTDAPGAGVSAYGGKLVVNVVATDAPDKADAVASLLERSGARAAVFAGDDVNDEPVFERAGPDWLTMRVGRDDPTTRANFCVDNCAEIAVMLDRMLALLDDNASASAS